jgi:tRNA uridine 5-carbamoylmethylation protein Kti12
VYLEVPYKTILERNQTRDEKDRVGEKIISKMMTRWEVPNLTEANLVTMVRYEK